jgi:hypothetical protein
MPVIYARNFAAGNQQYLSLGPNDYTRTLSIGNNWSRIRIGILCTLSTVSENAWPIRRCSLNLGVCRGSSSTGSVQAPTHSFGVGFPSLPNTAGPGSWTYNAGSAGNSYFSLASAYVFSRWAAGVQATSTVGSVTIALPSNTTLGGAIARRGIFILDINKSALVTGNITQGMTCGAVAHMALDITTADLYTALEWYTTAPVIQGTALTTLGLGNSLAFNEVTNGILDTVFVYWSHATVPLQLYEIAVYRVG